MKPTIFVSRGTTVPLDSLPNKSIALDGYVQGPEIDLAHERYSFDHHANCIRLVTRATCAQVLDAMLLGLNPDGHTIYINDVDGDTALATWLLVHPQRIRDINVRTLVDSVSNVDAHGPAYPTIDPKLTEAFYQGAMKEVSDLQRQRQYATADLEPLLYRTLERITQLLEGTLEYTPRAEKQRSYEITHTGDGYIIAQSNDFIFDLLYAEGHTKAVAYMQLPDGSYAYTVGKQSDLVGGFPVGPHTTPGTILHALNAAEPGWGGSTTIGGAPRNADGSRSHLPPSEVARIIDSVIKSQE